MGASSHSDNWMSGQDREKDMEYAWICMNMQLCNEIWLAYKICKKKDK